MIKEKGGVLEYRGVFWGPANSARVNRLRLPSPAKVMDPPLLTEGPLSTLCGSCVEMERKTGSEE